MLQLATTRELTGLHSTLYEAIDQYGKNLGPTPWGWPGGEGAGPQPSTYLFTMKEGMLFFCPQELPNRWWLAIDIRDGYSGEQLVPIFEFNIPKQPVTSLSMIFTRNNGLIQAVHKGKFTASRGSLSSATFFNYYRENPSYWPVMEDEDKQYVVLFTFDLNNFCYQQFYSFLSTMADFANYVTWYKDEHRSYQR